MCKKSVPSCLGSKLKMAGGGLDLLDILRSKKKMVMVMLNFAKKSLRLYISSKFYTVQKSITSWQVVGGYLEKMIYIRVYEKISLTTHRKVFMAEF